MFVVTITRISTFSLVMMGRTFWHPLTRPWEYMNLSCGIDISPSFALLAGGRLACLTTPWDGCPTSDSHLPNIVLGSAAVGGVVCRGGATHIHVVLQNLRSGLTLLGKAQLELDGLGDGVHIWDLTARLTQEPPHGGELGQGDPVGGTANTHLLKGVCREGIPREGGQQGSTQNRGRASTRRVRSGLLPATYARSPSPCCVQCFSQSRRIGGKAGGLLEVTRFKGSWGEAPSWAGWGGRVGEPPPCFDGGGAAPYGGL